MTTRKLLETIVGQFPRRKRDLEEQLARMGILEPQLYEASAAQNLMEIPTFDSMVTRPLSPMLKLRFEAHGSFVQGPEVWLALQEIPAAINSSELHMLHPALREHWEDSFPARFSDSHLSVFGYTPGVYDQAIYLAWENQEVEPLIAEYSAEGVKEFANLDLYLNWVVDRP